MSSTEQRTVWITGGGTGMGRATALEAARSGWRVAISGRRSGPLEETATEIRALNGTSDIFPIDVQDHTAISACAENIADRFGHIDAIVAAAGLNTPNRDWNNQDFNDFESIVKTNLSGVAAVIDAALPHLRSARGTIVIVSSYAAWEFQPGAGVAYSASKTALGSLVKTVNNQEAPYGIRACHLCPGDVATDFLKQRPTIPDGDAQRNMLSAHDVARAAEFVLNSPPHVRINELVISPVSQV